jgi:hypothetical protein
LGVVVLSGGQAAIGQGTGKGRRNRATVITLITIRGRNLVGDRLLARRLAFDTASGTIENTDGEQPQETQGQPKGG